MESSSQDLRKEILAPAVLQVSGIGALIYPLFFSVAYVVRICFLDKPEMLPTGGGDKSDDDSEVDISDSDSD